MSTPKAWFVYLLVADDGATYVGATVDLEHRLRQHNGQIGGGAKATHVRVARGQTWRRHCYVSGFPENHAALLLEWRWKSLCGVVQRQTQSLEPLERRLEALQRLLALDRPTSKATPYSSYGEGLPQIHYE
jgi:structure-specific endonuclease subunit SLX1